MTKDSVPRKTGYPPKDLTGQKFGRLTAIKFSHTAGRRLSHWEFQCECGVTKVLRSASVKSGEVRSCGCLHRETARIQGLAATTHGATKTRTYKLWLDMRKRVRTREEYAILGVDPAWSHFQQFLKDMGEVPEGLSLDLINPYRGYFPDNCRWATPLQQANNKVRTRGILLGEQFFTLGDIARLIGVNGTYAAIKWLNNRKLAGSCVRIIYRCDLPGWTPITDIRYFPLSQFHE